MTKTKKRLLKYDQAYYWPAWLAASLPGGKRRLISAGLLRKLCQANLDLWLALNLYDDCLDDNQAGSLLLEANKHYRRFLDVYLRLKTDQLFDRAAHQIINQLERANQHELKELRLKISAGRILLPATAPHFGPLSGLAAKSGMLALVPAAILGFLPKNHKCRCSLLALNFFRFALAAKQLADDIKDWRDDLQAGHLTRANWCVLRHLKRTSLSFKNVADVQRLDYIFIRYASPALSKQLANLCRRARHAASRCNWPADSPLANRLLGPIESGLQETQALRAWLSEGRL